jgi:hypothetical protein
MKGQIMPENRLEGKPPLWLLIEKEIQKYKDDDFSDSKILDTTKKIATELDKTGYNVSKSGGNWLQLKTVVDKRKIVGRPLIKDFDKKIEALILDDIENTCSTAMEIIRILGKDFPYFLDTENRSEVEDIVRTKRIELVAAKAKKLDRDEGIRLLLSETFGSQNIIDIMDVSENEYKEVEAKVEAELKEKKRVEDLLSSVAEAPEKEQLILLINENVSDELILEIGGFEQTALDSCKKEMEQELAEKKRKEEELAAQRAANAAGPALDEISPEDMLKYIEGLREILDFADSEKDIRIMSEQSSIPNTLVDIAVSDPDKLDELEKEAEG